MQEFETETKRTQEMLRDAAPKLYERDAKIIEDAVHVVMKAFWHPTDDFRQERLQAFLNLSRMETQAEEVAYFATITAQTRVKHSSELALHALDMEYATTRVEVIKARLVKAQAELPKLVEEDGPTPESLWAEIQSMVNVLVEEAPDVESGDEEPDDVRDCWLGLFKSYGEACIRAGRTAK